MASTDLPPGLPPGAGDPEALLATNQDVDHTVDLAGLGAVEALARVEAELAAAATTGAARIWFRFAKAVPGGGETLFQPVGRLLRSAIADGRIIRAMPAADGGWIARVRSTD